ncbi:PREDICTED: prohormone-1-like isoform X2 [Priapulus caudatus]|uniref:Prohormone-1-like isoform X2 n=1 Tax=Priapulus caudatus TaxID=37621 RepID=A0ABM1DVB1_PRICU|nr:PREDICTED: prohormone-1-like isoform X2 [Priapulus caudatus]
MQQIHIFAGFFAFVLCISAVLGDHSTENELLSSPDSYRLLLDLIDNQIARAMAENSDMGHLAQKRDYFRKCQVNPISCFGGRK